MRTTVDISDDVYRQAKAQAALRGIKFREFMEEALRLALAVPQQDNKPRRITFPLIPSDKPGTLTDEMVYQLEAESYMQEDLKNARGLRR